MNIYELFKIIENRVKNKKKTSYTNKLLKLGPNKIAQKFGEESTELIIERSLVTLKVIFKCFFKKSELI